MAPADRIAALLPAIAARMAVDLRQVDITVVPDAESLGMIGKAPGLQTTSGPAGTYRAHAGSPHIAISESQTTKPISLIATIVHELSHLRLLGEGRVQQSQRDLEQITDLATVFFGFGIFSANASFDFTQSSTGWRRTELGYLGEAMFGFALGVYADMRGEAHPPWTADLDTNPRTYMRNSQKYLARTGLLSRNMQTADRGR
ncbi:MAG TPA: hypothetical protein VG650_03605 [Mycobacteriales bacterium]|nr:hypothetical protein [Mycobacteriales bacterium]